MNPLRVATPDDVDVIADLIQEKRRQYEHYQPTFWRVAPSARDNHLGFLAKVHWPTNGRLPGSGRNPQGPWTGSLLPTSLPRLRSMSPGVPRV